MRIGGNPPRRLPNVSSLTASIRNQARIASDKSLLPSWEKVRMRVSRAYSPRPAANEPPPETKRESRATNPFSLDGRRLG